MPLYQTIVLALGIVLAASVWIVIGFVRLANRANRRHEADINAQQRSGHLEPKIWNNHLKFREQRIRRMNKLERFFTPYFWTANVTGGGLILLWMILRVIASFTN